MKVADKEELIEVLDENENFVGVCKTRSEIHSKLLFHNEIALWIIDKENKQLLLQRRSPNKRSKPNKLGLCAGHVVAGETIEDALKKEAFEEIGINLDDFEVKKLNTLIRSEPKNRCFLHQFYLNESIPLENFKIQEEELSEVLYMDFEEVKTRLQNGDDEFVFAYDEIKDTLEELSKVINESD